MVSKEEAKERQEEKDYKRDILILALRIQWNNYNIEKRHKIIREYSEIALIIEKLIKLNKS